MIRALICSVAFSLVLAVTGCTPLAPRFYDAAPINDFPLPNCMWTQRYMPPVIYQESDFIRTFFEPSDLAAYRKAIPEPFTMPARPLVRVSVLHFYEMVNGPVYYESDISVLAVHEGVPGWFVLKMPVTDGDACAGGRNALGTPKVMRRVTLERLPDRYVGTSYERGGAKPEFTLTLDVGEPGAEARELLGFVSPFSELYLLHGRVLRAGGLRASIPNLESAAPGVWKIRLGTGRIEYPRGEDSLLTRLGVGRPLASYWGRLTYRYSIVPR
jgi:hypothetical protein